MAQHMHDPAVFERRLRPIYDNLEVGNNRKALQETEKLLKKQPNLLCARALKGLALLRLGRVDESNGFLKAVADEKPFDDATLQVLSFCYKELEQLNKIVELYSNAVKQSPGNEELLAHLFISYVRLEDFKSQQSVALQLYKAQPKNAYYFWAVMSVVLQGIRGPESRSPEKRKIFLSLAQRMVDKFIAENKLETEQEVLLYLHILDIQGKYKEELAFLNSSISEKLFPGAPIYTKINLMKKLEKWQDINKLLKELLREDRDRWDYYKDYLSSCFELLKFRECDKDDSNVVAADKDERDLSILDDCHDFLCELIESVEKKVRGPYLARIELHKRMRAQNLNAKEFLGDFCELIVEYFRLFGDKSCCTHDITLFLTSIELEERQKLADKLLLESGVNSTILPQNKQQMQKHICALQISRICGAQIALKTENLMALYTTLKLHYEHGYGAFGKKLLHTDMGPSDAYALLAANVMYDISVKEQSSNFLFEALCLLQYVLRNSPSNFHVKLLSLKIYHIFGCILGAHEMYDYLDIKQIQLDSMGYVHCNLLPLSGRYALSRSVFDATLKFFTNSYKERLEYIALTYRFCTFSKLEEFMNFKERLTNSLHYVSISVEAQLCDLVTLYGNAQQNLSTYSAMSIEPAADRISWHELADNRDLAAIVRWDPVHLVNMEEERKESFEQEIEVLQIRSLILRLVAAFVDLFHVPPSPCVQQSLKTDDVKTKESVYMNAKETAIVELLRDSWLELFQRLRRKKLKLQTNRFLVDLLPSRLHLLLQLPYEKFFADLAQMVLDLYSGANNLPLQCKLVSDNVAHIVEMCCICSVRESNAAVEDGLWRRREWQNKVAAGLEMLSLYAFVLSVAYEKLQNPSKGKSKKKTIETEPPNLIINEKERVQLLVQLMRYLKQKLQMCENAIRTWKCPVLPKELNSFMSDMSLQPEVEATLISNVATIFKESHDFMLTDMQNLIKDKIRLVGK